MILKLKISNTEASTWWLPVTIKLCMLWRKQCESVSTACCPHTLTQFDNRWAQQPRLPGQREFFTIQIIFLQRWAFNNSKIKLLPNLSEYMNNEGVCFRNILVFVYLIVFVFSFFVPNNCVCIHFVDLWGLQCLKNCWKIIAKKLKKIKNH